VAAAATARVALTPARSEQPLRPIKPLLLARNPTRHRLVVVGASTGGPQAVGTLLAALPADFPVPLAVVVHIPPGFSQSLAEHLDRDCQILPVSDSSRAVWHEVEVPPAGARQVATLGQRPEA